MSLDGQFIQYAERLVIGPVRWIVSTDAVDAQLIADYDFIAHVRLDIPLLLSEVERLQGEVVDLETDIDWTLEKEGGGQG